MINLRKSLAIALTAATLSLGAMAEAPTASAHGFHGFHRSHGFHHFHRGFGRVGRGRFGWHHRGRFPIGHHWEHHWHRRWWGGEHHWGYGWGGYRRVVHVGIGVVPRSCPLGTHRGYLGKYCWPNR